MTARHDSRFSLSTTGRLILGAGIVAALGVALSGCFPNTALVIAERDVVTTRFDPNRNFANYMTYAMPDTVEHLVDSTQTNPDPPNRTFDAQILADVERNLAALGWTRVVPPAMPTPDVVVLVYASSTAWVGYTTAPCGTCYGGWPGWGYPGYGGGPGWGWGYPPWTTVPYKFNTGSVFVEMGRPQEADMAAMTYPVIWSMGLNGIVESSTANTAARIRGLIDQGFIQSPYLGDGK